MPVYKDHSFRLGASGQGDTTYAINQSIRFNDDDNAYLTKTFSSAGNRKTYTFSWWLKIGSKSSSSTEYIIHTDLAGGNSADYLYFYNDKFYSWNQPTGQMLVTNRLFRDTSSWYHFVFVHDSTQALSNERLRFYVNGERQTSFSTENYPSLDYASGYFNNNQAIYIGGANSLANRFDGYIAELHFLDGYGYGPEYFGEFKEDTDIWIPIEYTGSYGSNGFKIDGRDSSDLGDDESGNGNDFTATNMAANDQSKDSPTNNFCTLNPLDNRGSGTLSQGNLRYAGASTNDNVTGTIGMSSDKWYWEVYVEDDQYHYYGVQDSGISATGYTEKAVGLETDGEGDIHEDDSNSGNDSFDMDNGDVIGVAVDATNKKIWWSKNGQWYSADDASPATINISEVEAGNQGYSFSSRSPDFFMPFIGNYSHGTSIINFGQEGTFSGNITAGGNSDSNGIGNFKYSVPSGFLALCTRNLGS